MYMQYLKKKSKKKMKIPYQSKICHSSLTIILSVTMGNSQMPIPSDVACIY